MKNRVYTSLFSHKRSFHRVQLIFFALFLGLTSCRLIPQGDVGIEQENVIIAATDTPLPEVTLPAERPQYTPGELVEYIAQSGDTVPALAKHFNTTEKEIMEANPIIPKDVTTLPAGLPMQIPIYYRPLWGSSLQIIPDFAFVNGPYGLDFDVVSFVESSNGWLKEEEDFSEGSQLRGGEIIQHVANNYSIHPPIIIGFVGVPNGCIDQSRKA